jgi:hypothetical protein
MHMNLSPRACFLTAALLLLPGCGQKLNYETTVKLRAGEVQAQMVDAPRREQTVRVTATSSGSPIDAYLVLDKDKEAAKEALLDGKKPAAFLAGQTKTRDAILEATIPANSDFTIVLGGATKDSQVKVRATGR